MPMFLVANAAVDPGSLPMAGHGSLWQAFGGMAVVFGLLMLFLKFLGRMNRHGGNKETQLLTVWHLGPKREIQILRLGEMVHYIYRHEGSMVVLKETSHAEYLAEHPKSSKTSEGAPGWKKMFGNGLPFLGPNSTA
jgi:flagellar biogenesis protein FliO